MEFRNVITIDEVRVFPLRAKGGISPRMALGSMPTRPALLIRVRDEERCAGWGEIWANFPPRANIHKAHIIEDVVCPILEGIEFKDPREVQEYLRNRLEVYFLHIGQVTVFEHILAGIDVALWDLALQREGLPFTEFMGIAGSEAPSYASSINIDDLEQLVPYHAGLGQTCFKLKIGFEEIDDHDFLKRVARLCPADTQIMVDSNQSWDLKTATEILNALEEFQPLFAEEPLRADACPGDWEQLSNSTSIPIAAGENIYGVENFLRMASAGLRYLQPDIAKWGGMTGILELSAVLPEGVVLWPHFMGSAVGQMAALSATAAIGKGATCEMDVYENGLRTELCGEVFTITKGMVRLPDSPGLVLPPIPGRLAEFSDPYCRS